MPQPLAFPKFSFSLVLHSSTIILLKKFAILLPPAPALGLAVYSQESGTSV